MAPKKKQQNLYKNTLPHKQVGSSPSRSREHEHSVENHKFIIGQILFFSPGTFEAARSGGTFSVVRLLPPDGGDNQYRLKSVADGHERVVRESQLSLA